MRVITTISALLAAMMASGAVVAEQRQETGYYTSEERKGLKIYKTQKRFNWMTENNRIVYSTVCLNERKGSIEYRECRKRAKEYFKDKCNVSSDRFCHAVNNYNPL